MKEKEFITSEVGKAVGIDLLENNPLIMNITKDQDGIFLSSTMTGDVQLIRLEHIGYFRYNKGRRVWEAVLCDQHTMILKRETTAEMIIGYHPKFIQICQSIIVNVNYLALVKGYDCVLLPPFDKTEVLPMSKAFMKKFREKYISI